MQKPSIKDVAEHAGVSTATVSHVINNTRYVSESTTKKVREAIKALGYIPSAAARGLASKQSRIIGVVFSDISNPFFTSVYKGIEFELSKAGYELTLANTGEQDEIQEVVLNTMLSREVDGIIVAPTGKASEAIDQIIQMDIPMVMLDRRGPYNHTPLVSLNNVQAAYEATSHLIADGHKKIGIVVGLADVDTTKYRMEGYCKALEEYKIACVEEYICDGNSRIEGGYRAVENLFQLPDPPTALFITNNLMTLGALHAIRDLGLKCPEDIGIIGFDDHDWADIFSPPLTVIRQPTFRMGSRAAGKLIELLGGKQEQDTDTADEEIFSGELIVRGSCSTQCHNNYFNNYENLDRVKGGIADIS
jgi:LacI family transcriptional regulator